MRNTIEAEISSRDGVIDTLYQFDVKPNEPILIGDVVSSLRSEVSVEDLTRAVMLMVGTTFKSDAVYIDSSMIAVPTRLIIDQKFASLDPSRTAVLLPGQGAKSLWEETSVSESISGYPTYFLPTNRIVENGKVKGVSVSLNQTLEQFLSLREIDTFIVIDDVVATGTTLRTLRTEVSKYTKKPSVYKTITWFCRQPTDVSGYDQVLGVYRYASTGGYPALNSLSTLLRGDEKSRVVLERFIKRFVHYPYGFYKQLGEIKKLLKENV